MINELIEKIKQEKILPFVIAAAVISCIFVPASDLTVHIDTDTVGILFSVLAITAGLNENGVFDEIVFRTVNRQKNTRSAAAVLILLTFFTAPFITNIGALTVFVPFTMAVFSAHNSVLMYVLAVQTAAANIGCMIFPSASPCILFLFNRLDMTYAEFAKLVLPMYAVGFVLIGVLCLFVKKLPIEPDIVRGKTMESPYYIIIYLTLMFLDVLAVLGGINMLTVFASVCLVVVIMEPKIFSKVDYTLIILVTAMYILIGNLAQIRDLVAAFRQIAGEHTFEWNILFSQLIGDLPSVMLFSLRGKGPTLIISAVLGGIGPIASSCSGICTYRIFKESYPSETKKYRRVYFTVGIVLLAVMYAVYRFVIPVTVLSELG